MANEKLGMKASVEKLPMRKVIPCRVLRTFKSYNPNEIVGLSAQLAKRLIDSGVVLPITRKEHAAEVAKMDKLVQEQIATSGTELVFEDDPKFDDTLEG